MTNIRGMNLKKIIGPVLVITLMMASCTTSSVGSSPATAKESAELVCENANTQLRTASDMSLVVIKQCEVQTTDAGEVGFVLAFNDYMEWGLLETKSVEDIIYTIPLGLLAYAFAKSGVDPEVFDRLLVVLNGSDQSVYAIDPKDLRDILLIEDEAEARQALKDLRDKMVITG
jgi:hypothetical protein